MSNKNQIINNIIPSGKDSDIALKYHSSNPIIRVMMKNFLNSFNLLLSKTNCKNILELGSGEGYLSHLIALRFPKSKIVSSDISKSEEKIRKHNLQRFSNQLKLQLIDATNIPYQDNSFELIVCAEVLEHIPNKEKAISEIYRVTKKYALLSVPNEPIFHLLNLVRGKYLTTFSNLPDHVNHWSKSSFLSFLQNSGFKIVEVKMPFPWIMVLVEK